MRTQPNQLKFILVGFAVDQNEVRFEVAVTAIVECSCAAAKLRER